MKKFLIFIAGLICGVVLTIAVLAIVGQSQLNGNSVVNSNYKGAKFFDEPGKTINEPSLQVFQVIADDAALVRGKERNDLVTDLYLGQIYLLVNNNGHYYYDDEIIRVSNDYVIKQVGIYQYMTAREMTKTVPIIAIFDKEPQK